MAHKQLPYVRTVNYVKDRNAVRPQGGPELPDMEVRDPGLTRALPRGCRTAEARVGAARLKAVGYATHFPTA